MSDKTIETKIDINAPIQLVWDVLLETDKWNEWNPAICHVDKAFKVDEVLEMHVKFANNSNNNNKGDGDSDGNNDASVVVVTTPVVVTVDTVQKVLAWSGTLGGTAWIFEGLHKLELVELEVNKTTQLVHTEVMQGMLVPLLRWLGKVEEIRQTFLVMDDALKVQCEQLQQQQQQQDS